MAGNANSGRRPKPVALRIYEGNKTKEPLPVEPPTVPWQSGTMPEGLTGKAAKFWDWLVSVLEPMGVLTEEDRALMREACWHYHFAEAARDEVLSNGILYESFTALDAEGNVVDPGSNRASRAVVHRKENPAARTMARESAALERCLSKLGLSPTDRAKLAKPAGRKRESLLTG